MKKAFLLVLTTFSLIFLIPLSISAQQKTKKQTVVLNGEVKDEDGKPMVGASVRIGEPAKTVATDSNGYFRFDLPRGSYSLKVTSVGFYDYSERVLLEGNLLLDIKLIQQVKELQQVEISDQNKDKNVTSTQQGTSRMTISAIKKLPTLLGEVDIIRSLQTLPGVTTVGEGANGFNVRGGNTDQNLVLMDDVPIFNASHLLGFYSVFNPDAVRDMTLFRGGTPPQYGGRASSVLDIKLKEPNWDSTQISGGIGILASRLMMETPIVKEKMSLFVASRASYTDVLFPLLDVPAINRTKANFYDLTGKIRWKINNKNQLFITSYLSDDNFKITGDSLAGIEVNASSTLFNWKTRTFGVRWNHIFSPKLFANISMLGSQYSPTMSIPDTSYATQLVTKISQKQVKADFKFIKNTKHTFDFGATGILYQLNPGDLTPTHPSSNINPVHLDPEKGVELAAYVTDDWKINDRMSLTYGLRYAVFAKLGKGFAINYQEGKPLDELNIVDTLFFAANKVMKMYHGLEPRLSFRINVGTEGSVKMGFQRMQQFLQQVSNTTSALPTARWKLSDRYIAPQISDQFSVGYFQNLKDNSIETSVELYYKNIENMPDYRSGVNLLLLNSVETAILQGKGRSYGLEIYVRKKTGRTTGWLTYTYSRSEVFVNSPYPEDKPFSGRYYPTNFDKPHVVNMILNYYLNRRVNFTANFTYSSGRPVTYADDKYYVENVFIPNYTNRNLNRIPDYHRLDVSMNIEPNINRSKRFSSSWNLSIYNVYARRNAYSIFFRTKNDSLFQFFNKALSYRLAVIGTAVPSLTWNFKW
ncbi:MAG: TonB-dependent receptor [Saprospiraceae bacterium]|nr:TonB-dependent receptor [Saprospiraceae bacterium]